ncbi:hypothetical protein GCM10010244_79930 [Streptomyces coeruleorubidus]|nr:hypothetical protein GCM10010244_79930 [Streptomyces bellus]
MVAFGCVFGGCRQTAVSRACGSALVTHSVLRWGRGWDGIQHGGLSVEGKLPRWGSGQAKTPALVVVFDRSAPVVGEGDSVGITADQPIASTAVRARQHAVDAGKTPSATVPQMGSTGGESGRSGASETDRPTGGGGPVAECLGRSRRALTPKIYLLAEDDADHSPPS